MEVRHESFAAPEFIALARAHGVAIVAAADGEYPQIADPAAPFVYARIMGTAESEPNGYADAALDRWAARARTWAAGGAPEGLRTRRAAAGENGRDVFFYVISGHKLRNPAAAMALIERVG